MKTVETLIVGGGISGLATAWQLAQLGNEVQLWEAEPHCGGKIATDTDTTNGFITEQSASMVLNFRPEVSQFLRDSGLEQYKLLRTPTSKRYLVNQGKLHEVPMQLGRMLASPLWSTRGKLRVMLEPFILRGGEKNESVADFIRRRLGREMLDKAMSAYVAGTLASDPERADSQSVLPLLNELEQRYGSLAAGVFVRKLLNKKKASGTEGFSFHGGMASLTQGLSQQLRSRINSSYRVTHISPHKKGWLVNATGEHHEHSCYAQQLVLCTPAGVSADLVKPLNTELHMLLSGINYAPLSVVHLGFRRDQIKYPCEGTGFLTPYQDKLKLNGSMWMHSLFPRRAPVGHALLSNYLGGARHPEINGWSNQQRIDTAYHELKQLLGITGEPSWARIDHHEQALPLYHGKYTLRQQQIHSQLQMLPNLHLQANYLGGVSIRDRIIAAQTLALQISQQHGFSQGFVDFGYSVAT